MWKDFFYFSKNQRIGIVTLIILIVIVIALNYFLPLIFPPKPIEVNPDFLEEVETFRNNLTTWDYYSSENEVISESSIQEDTSYKLFNFDPNTADSITFTQLGIPSDIASRIVKYRTAGGQFKIADDLSKIYGLSTRKFEELKPYIYIEEIKPRLIDLNSADTTELMKVYGIGPYYAKQIVSFRNRAGGFYSVDQLLDIRNMRMENYERMKDYCTVDLGLLRKMYVNTINLTNLKKHPYINDAYARKILDFRNSRGEFKGLEEFKEIDFEDPDFVDRIAPYLSFD